jgi:hypothetical protein
LPSTFILRASSTGSGNALAKARVIARP